jgi:DNA-binding SARP family transcriptional activator
MRLLRADCTHERTHRQLMQLYALAGDRSMALRQFGQCRAALAQEFSVEPTAPTLALYEQLRAGHIGTARAVGAPDHPAHADLDILTTLLSELASLRGSVAQLQYELAQLKRAPGT